jgi:EpsI family protein
MKKIPVRWSSALPIVLIASALLFSRGTREQERPPLRVELAEALPRSIGEFRSADIEITQEEAAAGGATSYLYRSFGLEGSLSAFTVYVGYFASQAYGTTIHSPKNCLPGAGWQALSSETMTVQTAAGPVVVNRYLIQNGEQRALALYWYQGRGRVEANEYRVKWDLLRDAMRHGRSEEALVRVIVPVAGLDEGADELAARIASLMIPAITGALPS